MTLGLGIDAGGSATQWRLAGTDGACLAQGFVDALTGPGSSAPEKERIQYVVSELVKVVSKAGAPRGIIAGIADLGHEASAETTFRSLLAQAFELPPQTVFVAEDLWISYLSYFALGEGILVCSGEKAIGYHLSETKNVTRIGGRSHLIDDAGSCFWIGRQALKAILRAEDDAPGNGWSTPLGNALAGIIGGTDWNAVSAFVHGDSIEKMARLAPCVGAAAGKGDKTARRILREAGEELARLANCLLKRFGPRPVALIGEAARLHPLVADAFQKDLIAPVEFVTSDLDAALTAARLAATLSKA